MSRTLLRRLTPALLLAGATLAIAQTTPQGRPDPLDGAADVPRVVHRSPFAQYQRLAEQPVGSWREANETANRLGGWRAYAREAREPAPAPAAAASQPASAPGAAPAGHGGHQMK